MFQKYFLKKNSLGENFSTNFLGGGGNGGRGRMKSPGNLADFFIFFVS